MSDFTASNAYRVRAGNNGVLAILYADDVKAAELTTRGQVEALREYFQQENPDLTAARARWQHQEDARLGRWRWAENTDYVVYPPESVVDGDGGVWVMCESDPGAIRYLARPDVWHSSEAFYARAAQAYFDAHPEPKPWHDAKPGEVWVLTTENVGDEVAARVADVNDRVIFEYVRGLANVGITDPRIVSARRIWPEATS